MTVRERALGSRYQLETELGSGAMGTVWSARDLETGELVAAKILHSHFSADVGIVTRFLQERTFLTALDHPNIVKVRDLVVEGSSLGIVMDLVEGSDVRALLRERATLSAERAAAITADVLDALAHAHALSVLHRDVKPDNVLLDGDATSRARLSDFSIARLAQETTVRMTGVLGTADYMAPEVFAEQVSAASDVYGAGIMLYELVAGRTPFSGGAGSNAYAIARRHELALPPVVPGLPDRLWALLSSMLAKAPAHRPTAAEASAELRRLLPQLDGVPALPCQAAPATWEELATGSTSPGIALRSASAPQLDGEGTLIGQRVAPSAEQLPAAGTTPPLPAEPVADAPMTSLGEKLAPRPVVDVPELAPLQGPSTSWPLWAKVAAAVAVLALIVGGVVVAGALSGGSKVKHVRGATGSSAVSVTAKAEAPQTGLNISRSYSYDSKNRRIDVKVTWTSGSPLAGPFLESVPGVKDGTPCPLVSWTGPISGVAAPTDGLDKSACGQQVDVGQLGHRAAPVGNYSFPAVLTGDVEAGLNAYATRASTTQLHALAGLGASPAFAAQRLDSLHIVVADATEGQAVSVQVYPVWITDSTTGPSDDNVDPLFSSPGGPQSLLDQLGGADALVLTSRDVCAGSIAFTSTTVKANISQSGCVIHGQIGGGVEGDSNTFTVNAPGQS